MKTEAEILRVVAAAFSSAGALGDRLLDDTALLPPVAAGEERVITADMIVEGLDFDRALYALSHAGHRCVVQNLSDVAAAGARPAGFVWSLAIPPGWSQADVEEFARGAARVAAAYECPLWGGDLSATSGPFVCAVTMFGDVRGARLVRTGAKVGDDVWLSRPTGASAAGLRALRAGARLESAAGPVARALRAHLLPAPELEKGQALTKIATACMDVSDGLLLDLSRLAAASDVAFDLDALDRAVDVAAGATVDDARGGGEDWALVLTAPSGASVPPGCVRLGRVVAGEGLFERGQPLAPAGYDHFTR